MVNKPSITDYLESGLMAAKLRESVIANNIANQHTRDFRRSDVAFEDVLTAAIKKDQPVSVESIQDSVHKPGTTPVNDIGNDVSLEMEVGEMTRNTAMYKAYVRMLNKMYEQMSVAMRTE